MKLVSDNVLDHGFSYLAENATCIMLCADSDTSYANVNTTGDTRVLVHVGSLTSADFTIQDGSVSGRRITMSSHDSADISRSGTVDNLYILDTSSGEILLVTDVTTQAPTTGNKVNIPGFDDEILDPS